MIKEGVRKVKLRDIKEKIEDKMLDPDFTSKVSLGVGIVSLIVSVLALYLRSKYGTA